MAHPRPLSALQRVLIIGCGQETAKYHWQFKDSHLLENFHLYAHTLGQLEGLVEKKDYTTDNKIEKHYGVIQSQHCYTIDENQDVNPDLKADFWGPDALHFFDQNPNRFDLVYFESFGNLSKIVAMEGGLKELLDRSFKVLKPNGVLVLRFANMKDQNLHELRRVVDERKDIKGQLVDNYDAVEGYVTDAHVVKKA